jgi:diguanylate cyclase (GGDEF)-like protein
MVRKDGRVIDISISSQAVFDDDGNFAGVEGIYRDITQRKNLERELHRMASTDTLTGMANRRVFLERAEAAFQLASTENQPLALLMLDLDHFKQINDRLGHLEGDRVLIAFAQAVQLLLRADDTVGRLGGEEFGVLLPGSGHDGALAIAVRILQHIRDLSLPGPHGQPVQVATSIGLACQLPTDRSLRDLLTAQTVAPPSQAPGARPLRLRLSPGDLQSLRQARHALADLVHVGRGERQAQRGVVGLAQKNGAPGTKATPCSMARLASVAIRHLATRARQARPHEQAALGLHELDRVAQLAAQRIAHGLGALGVHPRTWASVAGMRPALRYCAAVAWAKVLVCASLNCLHMVALASSSAGAIIQPTRRPGDSTLLRLPQCTSSSRLPGTWPRASRLGGGAAPKYRSP